MIGFLSRPRVFIDEVKPGEVDVLAEIHGDAFARGWSADEFAALLSGTNVFALALRRESLFGRRRIMGFVIVRAAANEAEILTMVVRRGSRGRGYGRRLMEEALRHLYRDRIAACFLEVDEGNDSAVGLYRSLGFADAGARKRYYGGGAGEPDGNALVMRLQLR